MTGDRVYWHAGSERVARVPASCIREIVQVAETAEKVQPASCVAVFTVLALHADGDGDGARPKVDTIADLLYMSSAQVRRIITTVLIPAGVVAKRPNVLNGRKVGNIYTLARPEARIPTDTPGAVPTAPPGAPEPLPEARSSEQTVEQTTEQGRENTLGAAAPERALFAVPEDDHRPDLFEEFWKLYPVKREKPAARRAYGRAITRADHATILAGTARYSADPNRHPAYTKHPATWLNQDCWNDPPLPSRTGGPSPNAGIDTDRGGPTGLVDWRTS